MKSIATKLIQIQEEVGTIKKDKVNPFYKGSKYVDINSLLVAVLPILRKHGVLLSQPLGSVDGKPAITTILIDTETGENLAGTAIMPEINDPQKAGGAITYFRRYGLLSILGLGAEDDDANSTVIKGPTSTKKPAPRKGSYL